MLRGVSTKVSLAGAGGKVLDGMTHCRSSAALKKGRQAVEIWNDNGVFRPDEYSSGIDAYFTLLTAQLVAGLEKGASRIHCCPARPFSERRKSGRITRGYPRMTKRLFQVV